MKFVFATNNAHKVEELRSILPSSIQILPLKEAGIDIDIPEPHDTLQENAAEKAKVIFQETGSDCFSEDSGLEVDALAGEPGVRSARYAGEKVGADENISLLLRNLEGVENRTAAFKTVICLLLEGRQYYFEGTCRGRILSARRGKGGFGYDPVFVPEGETRSFGEMSLEEKNLFSHRKKATDQLVEFLNTYLQKN